MTETRTPDATRRPTGARAPRPEATPRLRMDPRIRERRVAVKRDEGRRRLRLLLVAGGVVLAVGSAYGATRSALFDVDRVEVKGAAATSPEAIRRAGGLHLAPQLADVEPEVVASAVERLPWVQDARVVRHWPGTVEVAVVERVPVAAMPASAGGWALVDRTGRVLEVQPEKPPTLAGLAAPPAPGPGETVGPEARDGLAVVDALPASLSQVLETVTVAEDGTLSLDLRDLPTVQFGPATQVRPKLVALSTLVARADLRGVRGIDVRVPTAPVLTRT